MKQFNQILIDITPDPVEVDETISQLTSAYSIIQEAVGFDNSEMAEHLNKASEALLKVGPDSGNQALGMDQSTQLLAAIGLSVVEAIFKQARDTVSKQLAERN